jgi:hypothetical protein
MWEPVIPQDVTTLSSPSPLLGRLKNVASPLRAITTINVPLACTEVFRHIHSKSPKMSHQLAARNNFVVSIVVLGEQR